MNVIDIGLFPGVDMSFLWLTVGIPVVLLIGIWVLLGVVKFKDPGTATGLGFLALIALFTVSLFVSGSVSDNLYEDRHNRLIEAVIRETDAEAVVDLAKDEKADIAVVESDGTGILYDFIELPGDHVGLLDVTEKSK